MHTSLTARGVYYDAKPNRFYNRSIAPWTNLKVQFCLDVNAIIHNWPLRTQTNAVISQSASAKVIEQNNVKFSVYHIKLKLVLKVCKHRYVLVDIYHHYLGTNI